ncbi:MAG: AAA family ATPase, partial [Deltaproteobacteria bacterium]|nr:AAA family ATPase [Deltaproteobacteria bacterium]
MPSAESKCHLFAWIGRTDLKAAAGDPEAGIGPIAQAVLAEPYQAIHLLSDFSAADTKVYIKWLSNQTAADIQSYPSKLSSPTNFGEIYEAATTVLDQLKANKKQL